MDFLFNWAAAVLSDEQMVATKVGVVSAPSHLIPRGWKNMKNWKPGKVKI